MAESGVHFRGGANVRMSLEEWKKRWNETGKKVAPVLLVLVVGMALLMVPEQDTYEMEQSSLPQNQEFDLERFEEKLEDVLSKVEGAGPTQVVLTLDTGSRAILAQDQRRSQDGEESHQIVTIGRGSGEQEVVMLQTVSPKFRGAVIVCPGGEEPQVRLSLLQAVTALTGLGADRIAISRGNL